VNDQSSIAAVKKSISILLNSIKEFTPRNHGNGWKLQKFHEHLHLPVDIYMFGSPQNFDNSPTEHGLIETAKHPADHAQKSHSLFVSQVTKRLLETALIKKAKLALLRSRQLDTVETSTNVFSTLPNSASFHITFDEHGICLKKWLGKKYLQGNVHLDPVLISWMQRSKRNKQSLFYDIDNFHVHLEYTRNEMRFRCHPNYKSNGGWYDWVMVRFDIGSQKNYRGNKQLGMWKKQYFPSKVMCFLVLPQDDTIYAIVHSTIPSNHENDSILFERWELENTIGVQRDGKRTVVPNLHVVDVDSFGDPILAVEDYTITELESNSERAMVTVVLPFAKAWPNKFMSSYRR